MNLIEWFRIHESQILLFVGIGLILYISTFYMYPVFFKTIILKIFRRFGLTIEFEGKGFIHPLWFRAQNLKIFYYYKKEYDSFRFLCSQIQFKIQFLSLLTGKIKIKEMVLYQPYLFYENKMNSFLKIHLLPDPRRVLLKNLNIFNGEIEVIDYLLPGPYQLRLTHINIQNAKMDLATPVDILFHITNGEARIENGIITARTDFTNPPNPTGSLILKNIKWTSVMGLSIPFFGTRFDLHVYYTHHSRQKMLIKGDLHLTGNAEENEVGIPFQFTIRWEDYRLPMDLALQKLVEKIFETVQPSLFQKGIFFIGKEFFDRVKKTP